MWWHHALATVVFGAFVDQAHGVDQAHNVDHAHGVVD